MSPRAAIPLAATLGAVVGFAVGARFAAPAAPPTTPPLPAAQETSAGMAAPALERALEQERQARGALEQEIARLREGEAEGVSDPLAAEAVAPREAAPTEEGFDAAGLLAAGIPPHEVARLQARFEAFELELLYLQDEANREGWKPPRLQQERRALRQEMRNELGDDDYDAMLYAAGRKNRVTVSDVLADSAADSAGLRKGDAVLQYGDERIFDAHALVLATRGGEPGALTEVRFERDGSVHRVFVPRGPIGIRLGRERRLPDRFQ